MVYNRSALLCRVDISGSCMCSNNPCINQGVTNFQRLNTNTTAIPLPLPHQILRVCYLFFSVIATCIKLRLHGKDVSIGLLFFFFDISRTSNRRSNLYLVDHDERGHPVGLYLGLGNLPLHLDKDGWYSVLGSWNSSPDDPNPTNQRSEVNLEDNNAIPAPAINPASNDYSTLPSIFCQYHKCSGNRCVVPLSNTLLLLTLSN